jgi:pyruvate kinase
LRPLHSPIYAFTDNELLLNQLTLYWGIKPYFLQFHEDPAMNARNAVDLLKKENRIGSGSNVVVVTAVNISGRLVDTILMETVE